MNRSQSPVSYCLSFLLVGVTFCAVAGYARADLNSDIAVVLADKLLAKAEVGIEIAKLAPTGPACTIIYTHNPATKLVPASNLKLLTTSAALATLGADFKFRTLLVRHNQDLVLIGDGDPTFGDAELLRRVGWEATTVYRNWADGLIKKKLTTFANVVVDDSVFDDKFFHPSWSQDQYLDHYEAEVGGICFNVNCLDFYAQPTVAGSLARFSTVPANRYITVKNECVSGGRTSIWITRPSDANAMVLKGRCGVANDVAVSVTVHDPSMYAGQVLADALQTAGVKITGQVTRDRTIRQKLANVKQANAEWALLAMHETPLDQALARANKDSVNLYAECLCKRLGFAATGQSGSWANGTAAMGAFLKAAGVDAGEYRLDDGCGLSKENTISANAIVRVLIHDFVSKDRDAFINSLSAAGQDGTLKKRFEGTDLRGRVFGKSGYVNNAMCLSGYLKAKDENWYAFSILINGVNGGAKPHQEAIVRAIDNAAKAAAPGAGTRTSAARSSAGAHASSRR